MKEVWKDVIGYEGIYQISSKKRVKALTKIIVGGRYNCPRKFKEKVLSGKVGDVHLTKNKKRKTFDIETLYQINFNGFKPKGDRKECIVGGKIISRRELVQGVKSKSKNKTSKYTGVHWSNLCNKWRAVIAINKTDIHLGLFKDELEAKAMYDKAVKYEYLYKGVAKLFRTILNTIK